MKKRSTNTRIHAFTLVELLVVIAIIAMLLAVLMPSLAKVRQQASSLVCKNNLKQIGLAYNMYVDNYNGKVLDQADDNLAWDYLDPAVYKTMWSFKLYPYLGLKQKIDQATIEDIRSLSVFKCRSDKRNFKSSGTPVWQHSYGTNYGSLFRYSNCRDTSSPSYTPGIDNISQIRRPSDIFLIMDSQYPYVYSPTLALQKMDLDKDGLKDSYSPFCVYNMADIKRHEGKINVVFVDGHSDTVAKKDWVVDLKKTPQNEKHWRVVSDPYHWN